MANETWTTGQLFNLDGVRDAMGGIIDAADVAEKSAAIVDRIADAIGIVGGITRLIHSPNPQFAALRTASALIQQIITDFLEQGVYTIYHHNLREAIRRLGIANLMGEPVPSLPPVATPKSRWNQLIDTNRLLLSEVADSSPSGDIQFSPLDDYAPGVGESVAPNFESWMNGILNAFTDREDSQRPRIGPEGQIGGFLFVAGAADLPSLLPIIQNYNRLLRTDDLRELVEGVQNLAREDLGDFSRFGSLAPFRFTQRYALGSHGRAPDFQSIKVSDVIPIYGEFHNLLDYFMSLLTCIDQIGDQVANFVDALERRVRLLSQIVEQIGQVLENLAQLIGIPGVSILQVDVEDGGVTGLRQRIANAKERPFFPPGSLLFGGGFFTANAPVIDLLKKLFGLEGEPKSTRPLATATFDSPDPFARILPPEDAVTVTDIEFPWSIQGYMNQPGYQSPAGRGFPNSSSPLPGQTSGGTGREVARRTGDSAEDLSAGGLGSVLGAGVVVQRDSLGFFSAEVTDLGSLRDEQGRMYPRSVGTGGYYVSVASHDRPRLEVVGDPGDYRQKTGLLLEPERYNHFPDSDQQKQLVLYPNYEVLTDSPIPTDVTYWGLTRRPVSAPNADLRHYLAGSGPVSTYSNFQYQTSGTPGDVNLVSDHNVVAVIDESGTVLKSVENYAFTDPTDVGRYIVGYQQVLIQGQAFDSPVHVRIAEVLSSDSVRIEPPLFTPPRSTRWLLTELAVKTGPVNPRLIQNHLPRSATEKVSSFSCFARASLAADSFRYDQILAFQDLEARAMTVRVLDGNFGPALGCVYPLALTPKAAIELPDGQSNWEHEVGIIKVPASLWADQGVSGDILEVGNHDRPAPYMIARIEDAGDTVDLHLSPLTEFGTEYFSDSELTLDLRIFDGQGTHQGFLRVGLSVPEEHVVQTAALTAGTNAYVLPHSSLRWGDAVVWVVEDDDSLTRVWEDDKPAGLTYKRSLKTHSSGRDEIVVSDALIAAYEGKRLQVNYRVANPADSQVEIYAQDFTWYLLDFWKENPPTLAFALSMLSLWRAQWENGYPSSPIPSTTGSAGYRAADRAALGGGGARVPESKGELSVEYHPTVRARHLQEDECLIDAGPIVLLLSPVGDGHVRAVLEVSGTTVETAGFTYQGLSPLMAGDTAYAAPEDARIQLTATFEYGSGASLSVQVAGVVVAEASTEGPVQSIDASSRVGAKMFLGSRATGKDHCSGRIVTFSLRELNE